jgi:hypothetical protein
VLFAIAAGLAWYLPGLGVAASAVTLIVGSLIIGGSIAILLYQSWMTSALERRLKEGEIDHANLRRLFKVLQAKLKTVQNNLDLAVSDCEDLRALNSQQARKIAEPASQQCTTAASEQG